MENIKQRVLAYGLATAIAQEELDSVSGGSGGQMTHRQTVKATAGVIQSADAQFDVSVDW